MALPRYMFFNLLPAAANATAQAVSRWLSTSEAGVRSQGSPFEVCG